MSISDRPIWKGLPVPYVTRWTGEVPDDSQAPFVMGVLDLNQPVAYPDETVFDRTPEGLLLPKERHGNNGEPQFSQVHTHRQIKCMTEPRCQICGDKLDRSQPTPWMLSTFQAMQWKEEGYRTENAPTCMDCVESAATLCPHLTATGALIFEVSDYAISDVFIELGFAPTLSKPVVHERRTVPMSSSLARMGIVLQYVAQWRKFRVIGQYVQGKRMDLEAHYG